MSHFTYTATKADGETYKGSAEAQDRFELYEIIRREGGHLVSVAEEKTGGAWWNVNAINARFSTIKEYDKILLARNLGAMLSAGLSLARALSVLERQTKNPRLSKTIGDVLSEVRRGGTLHDALAKFPRVFSKLFIAMVRAGEEGGDLSGSLQVTADQMERMHNLKKKIRGALIYPSIIIIAIIAIGILMMIYVVPTLASTFKEMHAELPTATKIVIGISDFLTSHLILGGIFALAFGVALISGLRTQRGRVLKDWTFIHMPLIGEMVREVNAARTSRTLASLLSSGVDVLTSLEICGEVVQNTFFRSVIQEASHAVGQGQPLSNTFAKNERLYPPFVGEMMAVGEETGQTNEMLKRLADYYEMEVDRKTKDLSTIIEPVLMLVIGVAVGFFAVSMIMPIYSLSDAV